MNTTVVPVQLTEGVESWLDRLDMQEPLQAMVDWVQRNVSGLQGIRVTLGQAYAHLHGERCAVIRAHRSLSQEQVLNDLTPMEWGKWKAQTFAPRVCIHFTLMSDFVVAGAGTPAPQPASR